MSEALPIDPRRAAPGAGAP